MTLGVSVIIPLFNMERYVANALNSVSSQDINGLQIIVVDDGSVDGSLDVVRAWAAATSSEVIVIAHVINRGLVPAVN